MKPTLVLFCAFIVLALAVAVASVAAQDSTELSSECAVAAQTWYDGISYDDLQAEFLATTNTRLRATDRFLALGQFANLVEAIIDAEYPLCIEVAREWYLEGYGTMTQGLQAALDGDTTTYIFLAMTANGRFGQARGYLAALGVELYQDAPVFLFK